MLKPYTSKKYCTALDFGLEKKMFKILDWAKIELIDGGEPKRAIS